jgi:hypothetical protein
MPQTSPRTRRFLGYAAAIVALSGPIALGAFAAAAGARHTPADDITVRGCVERDAASRSAVYKLAEQAPGTKVYRLIAPKEIDVGAHVGHTVDVTGTATIASGRAPELAVKSLTMVRASCSDSSRE